MRRKTNEQFIKDAKLIWGNRYDYSHVVYTNSKNKVLIRCIEHDELFEQTPFCHVVMKREGCPKCQEIGKEKSRKKRALSTEEFIRRSKVRFGEKFNYSCTKYVNQNTSIEIICPINGHGRVKMSPQAHLNSDYGCPKCAREHCQNSRKISKDEFLVRAKNKYGNGFDYSKIEYVGYEKPIIIYCNEHGYFQTTPFYHLLTDNGGCKECAKESVAKAIRKMTTAEFVDKAREIHGDMFDYSYTKYASYKKKLKIRCPKHDYVFEMLPQTHLNGKGCPICDLDKLTEYEKRRDVAMAERKTFRERQALKRERSNKLLAGKPAGIAYGVEEFLRLAHLIHDDDFDYRYVKSQYVNLNTPVTFICKRHNKEFSQTPIKHLKGQGCPRCIGRLRTTESFIEEAKEVHGDRYSYEHVRYKDYGTKVSITCKEHGDFDMIPVEHLRGKGCPDCSTSILETQVQVFLQTHLDVEFETQAQFPWLKTTRTMPLDIYIPQYHVAIECQGAQHFAERGRYEDLKVRQKKDRLKYDLCKEHDITVLYYAKTTYEVPKDYWANVYIKLDDLYEAIMASKH